jgi:hypothetical protein
MAKRGNLLSGTGAAAAGRAQAKQAAEWSEREGAIRQKLSLDSIQPRPGGDTRPLNPGHVVDLAESIDAVGLIEPLAVDSDGHLLAGAHRLVALQILAERDPEARVHAWLHATGLDALSRLPVSAAERANRLKALATLETAEVPVIVFPFRAAEDPARALAVETTENTQRRPYTREEVLSLVQRLRVAGYVERDGRPKTGEKALRPALSVILRKSPNTIRRLLGVLNDTSKTCPDGQVSDLERARHTLLVAVDRYRRAVSQHASMPAKLGTTLKTLERLLATEASVEPKTES